MMAAPTKPLPRPADATGPSLDALVGGAHDRAVMLALTVLMVALGATGAGMPYSIDEVLYLSGAIAMAEHGALSIANGYETFGTGTLVPQLMIVGPEGRITPQYPSGVFVLAWPFVALFGGQGLAVMNGIAAAAALWLTRSIALALFGDRAVALGATALLALASFLPDYASALWPHATALALALATVRLGIHAAGASGRAALLAGMATGLVSGLSLTVRVDAILIVPPLALWLVYAARAPVAALAGAGTAWGAALAVSSLMNHLKFGSLSPLTYGSTDGGATSLENYQAMLGPLALATLAAIAVAAACRGPEGRARRVLAGAGLVVLAAVAMVALAVPSLRADLARLGHGLHVLVVDMGAWFDRREGSGVDGALIFWDEAKQALGQSMPWIALLLATGLARGTGPRWRGTALCLLVIATVLAFFARLAWHGGMSANMRYLLPAVPFLAMLAALALRDLAARAERRGAPAILRAWGLGTVLLLGAGFAAVLLLGRDIQWLRQPFATGLLAVTAAAVAAAWLPGAAGRSAARGAQVAVGAALAFAVLSAAIGDRYLTQQRRDLVARQAAAIAWPGEPYVFVSARPDVAAPVLWDADGLLSVPLFDMDFLEAALRDGRRLIVYDTEIAGEIARMNPALRILSTDPAANTAEIGFAAPG